MGYDRDSAARTTVLDDQSDYYAIDSNVWLSDAEKKELLQKEVREKGPPSKKKAPLRLGVWSKGAAAQGGARQYPDSGRRAPLKGLVRAPSLALAPSLRKPLPRSPPFPFPFPFEPNASRRPECAIDAQLSPSPHPHKHSKYK